MAGSNDMSPAAQGLRFFGQATAGVTHEIKNCLALINEFNGLMGDLILAHEKGQPLNLERIKTLVGDIKRQVASGGEITANLNRFAHGADDQWSQVELSEHLRLLAALAQRQLYRRGLSLEIDTGGVSLGVRTQPTLLLLAWQQMLDAAMPGLDKGQSLLVRLRVEPGWGWVDFLLPTPAGPPTGPTVEPGLLRSLGAREAVNPKGLSIALPVDPDRSTPGPESVGKEVRP